MQSPISRLRNAVANLSLRSTIAIALVLGLSLPIALTAWRDLSNRRAGLIEELEKDHSRIVEVLAIGMQTPIWEVRPEHGRPLLDVLMRDERITAITVTAPMMAQFLVAEDAERAKGERLAREAPVVRDQETIGAVRVEVSTARVEAEIAEQWTQIFLTGFLQVALGILIIFQLLRFKVLNPVDLLVEQSRALASGRLNQPLRWQREDELGVLAKSFEETRRSLRELVENLERRNREVFDREAELANKTALLRATLENMTDGISFVDRDLRLVVWNDRLPTILGTERERLYEGAEVQEIATFNLTEDANIRDKDGNLLPNVLETFQSDEETTFRYHTADGREIDVRRRPIAGGGFVSTYTDVTEQVEAWRSASESLRLLEIVMDAVPAVIHVKDRDLRYRMVNRQFTECWGLNRDQAVGHTDAELFEGEVPVLSKSREERLLETRRRLPFYEQTLEPAHGEELVTWSTKIPLLDDAGEVLHILTVNLDITERKRVEQDRQRWLQLFQDAIESMPNGFAVFDTSKSLVICNRAYASLFDRPEQELVGLSIAELQRNTLTKSKSVAGRSGAEAERLLGRTNEEIWSFWLAHDEPVEVELEDGRWMLVSRHPTAEGGLVFVRMNITEQKRMQQALSESEERFRRITEAHPLPVVITRRRDDNILYASPATSQLWGLSQDEIVGSSIDDYYGDPGEREQACRELDESGLIDSLEVEQRRAAGTPVPVAITSKPLTYDGEEAIVTGIFDLTERKLAEQQIADQREALYQSEKLNALGALLAGVAHELNNPLSVVVGQALMLKETAEDPGIRRRAQRIGTAADRCSRIVKTFLAMARQSSPQRRVVDVREVIDSALEVTGYTLRSADIQVTRALDPDLPPVWADPDQLTQVLMNLIINAEQAMSEQTGPRELQIVAKSESSGARVRIEFHDTGPGIPAEVRSRIFEPFFTTKKDGVGTGVGLAVSQGIIVSHGGRIEVNSAPGKGTSFTILLPRSETRSRERVEEQRLEGGRSACRILVVDDEPEVSEMLTDILTLSGHEIETAKSGNLALSRLSEAEFDLILSDLRMPDLDGPGLFRKVQADYPHLAERIAFITGDALGPSVRGFLDRTGRPYLEKPFTPNEVRALVDRLIAEAQQA